MEEYFEEVKSRLKRFKLKGKKAQGYGAERYNSWKSKKTDHTRDYGKRSQKINERIAKRLRRDEKNEGLNNNIVDDEYEEKIEIEELRKKALEESQIPKLGEKEVTRKFNNIENMQKEEKKLLKQLHQIRVEKVKEKLDEAQIEYETISWYEKALIIKNVREEEIRKLEIYENGEIYLQSLSSMLPPIILEPKAGENILDMTAAPGGKTTEIAALTENKAYITACEKNKIRAERLKFNLQKQGVKSANIMVEDARKLSDYFSFDKILLDAPCSGSGTENIFDKNFSKELVERSVKFQEELLSKALKILKPGGEMVYSTCSILKQENEKVLERVLSKGNAQIEPITVQDIEVLPSKIAETITVCPTENYEGFFVAKIKKLR